jgi:hypothetical protein
MGAMSKWWFSSISKLNKKIKRCNGDFKMGFGTGSYLEQVSEKWR